MPAILPAQLKIQSIELASLSGDIQRFIHSLYDLLERYADHSYRSGEVNVPQSLVPSLRVPGQVVRQISSAVIDSAPDARSALALCDALWDEPNLECKLIAGRILGRSENLTKDDVLVSLHRWQPFEVDEELQRQIFNDGLFRILNTETNSILEWIDQYLESKEQRKVRSGLILLECLVKGPRFTNSPAIFRRISPYLRQTPLELRPTLISLLHNLARRFPQETTYVLMESLRASENPDTVMLVRQILDQLPEDLSQTLRRILQDIKNNP